MHTDLVKFIPFSTLIPVELTSFTASVVDGNVVLNWITATELNNSGFEIQKGITLRLSAQREEWESIGFVNGNGTSTETHTYSFADQNPVAGKSYYRLKQIDFDGSFEYSNIVEVDFSLPIEFSLEQNYPNPFNPSTTIRYSIPSVFSTTGSNLNVVLKVYDVLGNEIAELVNEEKPAGNYEVNFDASKLSSGVYFYQLQASDPETISGQGFVETKKMILIR